ncbi:putative ABC transporter ATP-binding protein [uncultured archaeon]|nr:putative ABC transporter ATP-binding protein [uncultured archaeon]
MTKSIIKLEDVWKRYNMGKAGGLTVLKEIDFDIKEGEFVAISGPSGSGKSTIMHLIGALDTPSYGDIYLKEENIKKIDKNSLAILRGKTIGFIFQQFNLLPTFSALENVMMPMELVNLPDNESRKRAEELLTQMGLSERMHHKPTELSGGQQQRVAIARALANDPEVIIADEPTGNLDSKTGFFVMDFLLKLNKEGKTIIMVTHEMELVKYASRVIYLKDGIVEKEVHKKQNIKSRGSLNKKYRRENF